MDIIEEAPLGLDAMVEAVGDSVTVLSAEVEAVGEVVVDLQAVVANLQAEIATLKASDPPTRMPGINSGEGRSHRARRRAGEID